MLHRFGAFIRRLWSVAPTATVILAVSLAAGLYFAGSTIHFLMTRPPIAPEQPVATWMTPRYVSHSWRVPRNVLFDAIDFPRPPPDGPMSLAQLADLRGVPVEQVIAEAEAAIAAHRALEAPKSDSQDVTHD